MKNKLHLVQWWHNDDNKNNNLETNAEREAGPWVLLRLYSFLTK